MAAAVAELKATSSASPLLELPCPIPYCPSSARSAPAPPTDGTTRFRVWAPRPERLVLRSGGRDHELADAGFGVYEAELPVAAGEDYVYVIEGVEIPDPATRWQPAGLRGPSRVLDTGAFEWTDDGFTPPDLADSVIYELHVGTFTPEGTFDAVIPHLRALRELGITTIELLPVAEFPGAHGWGYDGVYLSAAHSAYGGPRRAPAAGRRRPRRGPRGAARRGLQPRRRVRRAVPRGVRPVLHRHVRDRVGQSDELRRRPLRRRPRVGAPERRGLDPRLPLRRAAARRHPRDPRRRRRPPRPGAVRARARARARARS